MIHPLLDVYVNAATAPLRFADLELSPIALEIGWFQLRWYSLAYLGGVLVGWWYLLKLIAQPGAPMARRHVDAFPTWAMVGIILGGRLGYVLFYRPDYYLAHPLETLRLWEGGMSLHGGVIGTVVAIVLFARANGLNWLRVHDYVACCAPFGLGFGRLANFVNGELWGMPTHVTWGMIFPNADNQPRHPSQLYEAGLEGVVLFAILWFAFWRTDARYRPGMLVGLFILFYGLFRFLVEFFREPDQQLVAFAQATGLHMGQWLCVPMILGGAYLVATANGRRQRVTPIAGGDAVA